MAQPLLNDFVVVAVNDGLDTPEVAMLASQSDHGLDERGSRQLDLSRLFQSSKPSPEDSAEQSRAQAAEPAIEASIKVDRNLRGQVVAQLVLDRPHHHKDGLLRVPPLFDLLQQCFESFGQTLVPEAFKRPCRRVYVTRHHRDGERVGQFVPARQSD
jgi:hypothetical protein